MNVAYIVYKSHKLWKWDTPLLTRSISLKNVGEGNQPNRPGLLKNPPNDLKV